MKGTTEDYIGKKFNRLTIIRKSERSTSIRLYWLCKCDCGKEHTVRHYELTKNIILSCGCHRNEQAAITGSLNTKHGLSDTPEYFIWHNMIDRCYNPSNPRYERYGGRGIIVCDRWLKEGGVSNFYQDVGPRPTNKHTIDRKDNDGNYEPGNCKWSTRAEQNRNHSRNQNLTFNGRTLCITDWAEVTGITKAAITKRLKLGWSVDKTLTTPLNPLYQHKKLFS